MATRKQNGKVALVTGANKGLGLETARQLARDHAFTILVGARDETRGQSAVEELKGQGLDAHLLPLVVTDAASIREAAQRVEREFGVLDVLINNAGIYKDTGPPSSTSPEMMRETYETNVFAPIAVIREFLPLLRASETGRIVNMSSGLGSLSRQSDPNRGNASTKPLAYDSSKTALNAVTVHFAYELRDTPIKINSAAPGHTATDLNNHTGPRTVEQGAVIGVRLATLPTDGPTGGFFDENGPVNW